MIEDVISIAKLAGARIMDVYTSCDFEIEIKKDDSPVTKADKLSHQIILAELQKISPFPVMSEEAIIDYDIRKNWDIFWLVDPLDGTKGFISKNGEFTVNIALIQDGNPVCGVVYLPKKDVAYSAYLGKGAFRNKSRIFNNSKRKDLIAADSHFYSTQEMQAFFKQHQISEVRKIGSTIKICYLAEGKIDVYPRLNETKEWDTAAVHIIANEAGCKLIDCDTKNELIYNKQSYKNNHFIASRNDLDFMS